MVAEGSEVRPLVVEVVGSPGPAPGRFGEPFTGSDGNRLLVPGAPPSVLHVR